MNEYYGFILIDSVNEKTGKPLYQTRQLLTQLIVTAWDHIPEKLAKMSLEMCVYKFYGDCNSAINQ